MPIAASCGDLLFRGSLGLFHESIVLIADRQANFETSALAGLADHHDLAFVARDNSVRGRKAKAAAEFSLSGKERFEDSRSSFGRHAATSVSDPKTTALDFRARADLHGATFGHGIHGIENKV